MRRTLIGSLAVLILAAILLGAATIRESPNFNDRFFHETRYQETVPALIPATPESLWTADVWIEEITLTNASAAPVSVTIQDRQATPRAVLHEVPLDPGATYVIRFVARYCPNGVQWVASTANTVVGYVRVKR